MFITYPLLEILAKIIKIDKQQIRLFYIEVNNILVNSINYKFDPSDILLLMPHCLQHSVCTIKITHNAENCIRCGKCNIKDLLDLSKKYNTKLFVAAGGTFARKVVSEVKPKAIIAVACERDLLGGIQDVKDIPVFGVLNQRPNGPCCDTKVDILKVEDAIRRIT